MANTSPAEKLALDLRNLHDVFIGGDEDLRPWYAEAQRISEKLSSNTYGFDDEALESMTVTLFYYLGDADLAAKDENYRAVWERWLRQFIETLERPRRSKPPAGDP